MARLVYNGSTLRLLVAGTMDTGPVKGASCAGECRRITKLGAVQTPAMGKGCFGAAVATAVHEIRAVTNAVGEGHREPAEVREGTEVKPLHEVSPVHAHSTCM